MAGASASSPTATRSSARCSTRWRRRRSSSGVRSASARRRRPGSRRPTRTRPCSTDNADVEAALRSGTLDVVGAVAWTWSRPEFARPGPALDVLVVDEAGQMSLANVLACAPAARSIVLLGDPQQLDQPTQGSHPPGAERSALAHLLADPAYLRPDRATIRPDEGLFLDTTWRLHPEICDYTSRAFYADRLRPRDGPGAAARHRAAVRGPAVGDRAALPPGAARRQRHRLGRGGHGDRGPRADAAGGEPDVGRPRRARGRR